jgi:hypothetical protein
LNANESPNVIINSSENLRLNMTPPPEAMDVDAPIAFPADDAPHDLHHPHDQHPLGRINESLYEESGIWRFSASAGRSSARPTDAESDSDGSEDLGWDDGLVQELAMEDCDDVDQGDIDEEEDAAPWQHGMSAIDALDEEFEKEASQRGK